MTRILVPIEETSGPLEEQATAKSLVSAVDFPARPARKRLKRSHGGER